MPSDRPLAVLLRYRVTNPDAADYGRVGVAVDILDESDLHQRTVWIVLDFGAGSAPTAFHRDEIARMSDV